MNHDKISPDDPRLTAYALNEMAPAERAEFEQALAQDAAVRHAVAEINATVATLTSALEEEPCFPESATGPAPAQATPAAKSGARHDTYAKVVRFPYWKISSLAAACFAVVFLYWQRNQALAPAKQYIEMQLPPPAAKTEEPPAPAEAAEPVRQEEKDTAGFDAAKKRQEEAERAQSLADTNEAFRKESRAEAARLPTTLRAQSRTAAPAAVQETASAPAGAQPPAAAEEKIVLSPFTVGVAPSLGAASSTLAGSRIRTQLSDLPGRAGDAGKFPTGATFAYGRTGGEANTEAYGYRRDNDYLRVVDNPLSTFSVDVDTASYANVRRFLTAGRRPPADAVRLEELINYFPYNYPAAAGGAPFAAHLEVASAPWAPAHRLVRIGLRGRELSEAARPAANLVFLLDVSGSMNEPNKLPLVKQSLRLLVEKLRPDDRVAIAVYAGASGLALPSTSAAHKTEILEAIDRLQAGGPTNGAMGIQLAYDLAKANFIAGGVNRVILATDGDFNVGVTSEGELVRLVGEKAQSGVFLTVLGFGMGNLKDHTLEQLADRGNGNYAYIDNLAEARKTLVEQAGGTLVTIAKDVKIQVEFNPAVVQAYRLLGYENRLLAKEDFNNDRVDAGEVGAGHTVTALYEVVPVGGEMPATGSVDALKYSRPAGAAGRDPAGPAGRPAELLTVKIRYKEPAGDVSSKLEFPLRDAGTAFAQASPDFKFAAAVAAFGLVLRDSPHKGSATLTDVIAWARDGLGSDAGGYRSEFIGLVERAQQLVQ